MTASALPLPTHPSHAPASVWVSRFAPLVSSGEVLDLACGAGRHARFFAARGHAVLALDRNADALSHLAAEGHAGLTTLQYDLEANGGPGSAVNWPFAVGRFVAIIVTNYLHRPLLPYIVASLAPEGVLLYETFARGNEQFGKPSNPDFLLLPGELLSLAASSQPPLRVIAYEDVLTDDPAPAMVQRLCAIKR